MITISASHLKPYAAFHLDYFYEEEIGVYRRIIRLIFALNSSDGVLHITRLNGYNSPEGLKS